MLLFALFPAAIHQSIAPLTHLLLAACLIWAWNASGNRKRPWLAGLMVGFAILVRPASALAGLVVGWRLGVVAADTQDVPQQPSSPLRENREFPLGRYLRVRPNGIGAFLLPALALPGLWLAFTALTLGRPVLNEYNAYNFFLGNNPHTPLYETWWLGSHEAVDSVGFAQYTASLHPGGTPTPDDYSRAAWQHIADRPDLFVVRTLARMRTLLAFDTLAAGDWRDRHPDSRFYLVLLAADALIGVGILLFGGLGLMVSLFRREKAPPYKGAGGDVFLLLLALTAPYWLAFSHPTYHLPLLPFLALFVVEGGRKYLSLKWLWKNPRLALAGGVYALALLAIQAEWVLRRS
jgi:hypothetical protein